jgi:RHS repeat-associated protein
VSTFIFNSRQQPCWVYATTGTALPWNTAQCTGSATPGTIFDLKYDFSFGSSNNGNVMGITNNRSGASVRSQLFTYDSLNRILTAKTTSTTGAYCWDEQFGYDAWGNLLSIGRIAGYSCSNEELLSVTATTKNQISGSTYDSAGNLISDNLGHTYAYNAENQLISTAGVTYNYDGNGKRVQKSSGKLYWYGISGDALDETDAQGNTNNSTFSEYVFLGGHRIARRDYLNSVSYYFADHLGTARVVTNASGTILDDSDFYPFGGERVISSSSGNRYKFTHKERDSESGLDNFGARYYLSSTVKFMSPDCPIKSNLLSDTLVLRRSGTNMPTCKTDQRSRSIRMVWMIMSFSGLRLQGRIVSNGLRHKRLWKALRMIKDGKTLFTWCHQRKQLLKSIKKLPLPPILT